MSNIKGIKGFQELLNQGYSKDNAAKKMKISRPTLRKWMRLISTEEPVEYEKLPIESLRSRLDALKKLGTKINREKKAILNLIRVMR